MQQWSEFTDQVREFGQYATDKEAERVTRIVLSALGGHLGPSLRAELARRLPYEAGRMLADWLPATGQQSAAEFVAGVAARIEGATEATARWDVSSVLCAVAQAAGDDLVDRILAQLPEGFPLLFGRGQLV